MGSRDDEMDREQHIEEALRIYLDAWFEGTPLDLNLYLALNSTIREALRERIEEFHFVAEGLPDPGWRDEVRERRFRNLGDFKILREVGRGGMGTVYEAEQRFLKRRVALKVLPSHLSFSEDAVRKFHREAEAGGRQRHPGIVAVHAVGEDQGTHYIVQELVEGGRSLADLVDELNTSGTRPRGFFRRAARILTEVASALEHAHAKGVIHRDVKPSNILLTKEDRPKVTDFGLAKVEDALALTRSGDFSGTPYYMAPEQVVRGRNPADHRVDVYALGVTLYELLTLKPPFEGRGAQEIFRKILEQEPRDPRAVNPDVPLDLSVICLKAIEKEPDRRYSDAKAFREDLEHYLAGEPIRARPQGRVTRLVKRIRRNRTLSAVAGVALAAVLTGIVMGPYLYFEAVRARDEAERSEQEAVYSELLAKAALTLSKDPYESLDTLLDAADRLPESPDPVRFNGILHEALNVCRQRGEFVHGLSVLSAVISPDGRWVATGSTDHRVLLLDFPDLKRDPIVLSDHTRPIRALAFATEGDRMASGDDGGKVILWKVRGETPQRERVLEFTGGIRSLAFGPGAQGILAVGTSDSSLYLVADHGDGETTHRADHAAGINEVAFDESGRFLVTASDDTTARIRDGATGEVLVELKHDSEVRCARCFGKAPRIVTGDIFGVVRTFSPFDESPDSENDEDARRVLEPVRFAKAVAVKDLKSGIRSIARHCGRPSQIVVGLDTGRALFVDLESLEITDELKGHAGVVNGVAFDPSRPTRLVTACGDGRVRTWDFEPLPELTPLEGEAEWKLFGLDPRGRFAAWRSSDKSRVRLRALPDHSHFDTSFVMENQDALRMHFPAAFDRVAIEWTGNYIDVFDLTGKKAIPTVKKLSDVRSLHFRDDGMRFVMAMTNERVMIYDLVKGRETGVASPLIGMPLHDDPVVQVRCGPSGKGILARDASGRAWLWNDALTSVRIDVPEDLGRIGDARFLRKGERILLITESGNRFSGHLWDVESGERVASLALLDGRILHVEELPEEDAFLVLTDRGRYGEGVILNAGTGRLRTRLKDTPRNVVDVRCDPRGRNLLILDGEGVARLFDIQSGRCFDRWKEDLPLTHVAFGAAGDTLFGGGREGRVRRRPLALIPLARRLHARRGSIESGGVGVGRSAPEDGWETNRDALKARVLDGIVDSGASLGLLEETLRLAERACDLDRSDPKSEVLRAGVLFRMGRLEEASDLLYASGPSNRGGDREEDLPRMALEILVSNAMGRNARIETLKKELRRRSSSSEREGALAALVREALASERRPAPRYTWPADPDREDRSLEFGTCHLTLSPRQGREFFVARFDSRNQPPFHEIISYPRSSILSLDYHPGRDRMGLIVKGLKDNEVRVVLIEAPDHAHRRAIDLDPGAFGIIDHIAFHPDGESLFLCGSEKDYGERGTGFARIDLNDPKPSRKEVVLVRPKQDYNFLTLAPQGHMGCLIHFPGVSSAYRRELYRVRMLPNHGGFHDLKRLTWDRLADEACRISPDGRYVYWIGHGHWGRRLQGPSSPMSLFRMDLNTERREEIFRTHNDECILRSCLPLADGRVLLLVCDNDKKRILRESDAHASGMDRLLLLDTLHGTWRCRTFGRGFKAEKLCP